MTQKEENVKPDENKKLVSTKIGEIKKDKKKGPITVLVIMVFLIGFAILLPNIADFIKNLDLRNIEESLLPNNNEETPNEEKCEEETPDYIYYDFLEATNITYDNVTYSGFKLITTDDTYLEFSAVNTVSDSYNLSTKNLYFELYDSNKTLLERVKIVAYTSLEKNSSKTFQLLVNQNLDVDQIRLIPYSTEDYPAITLSSDSEGNSSLTCTNLNSKFIYSFTNDKLTKITESYNYTNEDLETYATVLTTYKAKQEKLDNINGITATLAESGVNFSYNAIADLSLATITNLDEPTYFAKDTLVKIVNFEMEAMRYTCE
ncbi:MAG TPA: hypothetical protein PLX66_01910 [Bacilli bacterium]|nr:hypothetical protein [Bacilli bacterium]